MPTRSSDDQTYAPAARKFHWWTVALVFLTIPLAKVMTYRGNDLNIWDATTNALYTAHKSIGFIIFWLVLASLPLFALLPLLLNSGWSFWPSLLVACAVTIGAYFGLVWLLQRVGVQL